MKKKNLALSTLISTAILGLSATGAIAHLEPKKGDKQEKCYGVAKAGKNDCGSKVNKHACMGQGKVDNDLNEWVKMPSGLCEKLVGGSLAEGGVVKTNESADHDAHVHTGNKDH